MPSWKILVPLTVAALVAIVVLEPDYLSLQTASSPEDLRAVVGDDRPQGIAAALADVVFAIGYGLLLVAAYAALTRGGVRILGFVLAIGGAAADVVENVLVVHNVARAASLTQGPVDAMLGAGQVKSVVLLAAVTLLVVLAGRRLWTSTRGTTGNG